MGKKKAKKLSKRRIEKAVVKVVKARTKAAAARREPEPIPKDLHRLVCCECKEPAAVFEENLKDAFRQKEGKRVFRMSKRKVKGWCTGHAPKKAYL